MKRLRVGVFAIALVVSATGSALAASGGGQQVPILFNDRHVYASPDELKSGRVLAALVKGGTILVPLRAMFEQMGATVSYDPGTKTATVSKAGAEVKVTVGKPEVVINGESRPLDVPPEIYQGTVVVPVRVISEGMGAYVQWVPDQHVVVVRYIPPTPPPTPVPTMAPAPEPTMAPTAPPPPPAKPSRDLFVAGDYLISPSVYNEFSPGNSGTGSYNVRGAYEFNLGIMPFMAQLGYGQYQYPHNGSPGTINAVCNGKGGNAAPGSAGCVTVIGGLNAVNVAAFTPSDTDFDGRIGMKLRGRVYIAFAYRWTSNNYGYAQMNGFGEGIQKLPDLDRAFSFFGEWMYYPKIKGTGTTGNPPAGYTLEYILTTYDIGVAYVIGESPVFVEAGWGGQSWVNRVNAPSNRTYSGAFVGLGLKF